MHIKRTVKDAALRLAPKPIQMNMAFNMDAELRTHELLSLSRDIAVISVLAIATPFHSVQNSIFERYRESFGLNRDSNSILLSLVNNRNRSEHISKAVFAGVEEWNEVFVGDLHRYEMNFTYDIVDRRLYSVQVYGGELGITGMIAKSEKMSPAIHDEVLNNMLYFVRRHGAHMYRKTTPWTADMPQGDRYSPPARKVAVVIQSFDSNPSLNDFCIETLAQLKRQFDEVVTSSHE